MTSRISTTSKTSERRDKLGRRIGYNWWREYICQMYWPARDQWVTDFEQTNTSYYPGVIAVERRRERRGGRREVTDWLEDNPPPTLKDFLIREKGMHDEDEDEDRALQDREHAPT